MKVMLRKKKEERLPYGVVEHRNEQVDEQNVGDQHVDANQVRHEPAIVIPT